MPIVRVGVHMTIWFVPSPDICRTGRTTLISHFYGQESISVTFGLPLALLCCGMDVISSDPACLLACLKWSEVLHTRVKIYLAKKLSLKPRIQTFLYFTHKTPSLLACHPNWFDLLGPARFKGNARRGKAPPLRHQVICIPGESDFATK
jgi:hypothetical protein